MASILCPGCQKKFKVDTRAKKVKWIKHRKKCQA